ncbi:Rieske 2Fe-2S domain-containing protein [Pontivivens insulae]|uniref:Naphthalene 1,2-dioxygenase/salicylate 5-hydroxylase systems, ferredoxin component n=1 Tax=Pontivivens insulae TaxID=1639689 RepID=A0A2R8AFE9_9RHOB|nr:Rieske 2Fe-2S domain-containing protein [Pontivivens insulae]RED12193.1 nitrite reductase/ring-hydroxylating ferredoxin subunit [Pontivivens insulae]SPF30949.1 Naphthalene 1,2-dioxygenase/salicylate 5-hydroxylase systems, ferredoxin component [Pontivivens insulae]
MSVKYIPVQWNPNKYVYDAVMLAAVAAFLWFFMFVSPDLLAHDRPITGQIRTARAFGACAFFMLTVILCIGPLARLDARFLPLLYNRRHFGVMAFFIALTHAYAILGWYFSFTPIETYEALLSTNTSFDRVRGFPFEILGLFALLCLGVLALTSHDFWMKFLTPPIWKALHFLIYAAYAAVIGHVALGVLQDGHATGLTVAFGLSGALVIALHLAAVMKDRRAGDPAASIAQDGWEVACHADQVEEGFGKVAVLSTGERVAVFRQEGKLSAISNACSHQNGPLGEGRIIDCLVTCPWHGFQYNVTNGRSPEPFTETVPTYDLRIDGAKVLIRSEPNPPGTYVEPVAATPANKDTV